MLSRHHNVLAYSTGIRDTMLVSNSPKIHTAREARMFFSRLFSVLGRQVDSARAVSQRVSSSSTRGSAMKTTIFVLLLAVALSACAPAITAGPAVTSIPATSIPPTVIPENTAIPNPQPTASPTGPAPWSLVAVGDSLPYNSSEDCPGCTGFVDRYAAAITKATGHPVKVQNLSQHNGLQTDGLLEELKTDVRTARGTRQCGHHYRQHRRQ